MAGRIFVGEAVFCLALGFLSGVLAAGLGWHLGRICLAGGLGALVFIAMARSMTFRVRIGFAALFLLALCLGSFYYFWYSHRQAAAIYLPIGRSASFFAVITSEPRASTKYLLADANVEKPFSGTITIFLSPYSKLRYGDEVVITGKLEAPKTPGDTPAVFPSSKKIRLVAEHRGFWPQEDLMNFKAAVLRKFQQFLPADSAALLGGEVLGGMDGMSTALKNEMSVSGTSYVVSMYGFKIAMLIFILEAMLAEWIPRRARFLLLVVVTWLFVLMAGGNISAVRAAIMATLALVAKLSGRAFDGRHALVLTAAAMAIWDPTVVAQASFELSFLSLAGIFYLVDPLKHLFRWRESGVGFLAWREAVVIAVATLLPIVPIIAVSFGDFSLTAFPSNILISFGVLPAMIFGAVLAVLGFTLPPLASLVARVGQIILWYQLFVIKLFAAFVIPLPFSFAAPLIFVLYFAALAAFAYFY
jgi:ComEC/Rec2-related protein